MSFHVSKIISGGQTGVDRAALDVAIFCDIAHGGWCPLGRRAEDGPIPETYELQENDSRDYSVRTEQNVVDSDGTLILFVEKLSGGTKLTGRFAKRHRRPHLCIDLSAGASDSVDSVRQWLSETNISVLNVAGPRESTCEGITKLAERFLLDLFDGSNSE